MQADTTQAADASDAIGEVTTPLVPPLNPPPPEQASGESSMGLVVADAQLAATAGSAGAVIAFMNPGGVRAGLDVGPVTVAEANRVQPFNNTLTTMTLTGAQIEHVLEAQDHGAQPGVGSDARAHHHDALRNGAAP